MRAGISSIAASRNNSSSLGNDRPYSELMRAFGRNFRGKADHSIIKTTINMRIKGYIT